MDTTVSSGTALAHYLRTSLARSEESCIHLLPPQLILARMRAFFFCRIAIKNKKEGKAAAEKDYLTLLIAFCKAGVRIVVFAFCFFVAALYYICVTFLEACAAPMPQP